ACLRPLLCTSACVHQCVHSFPTRRSSDLQGLQLARTLGRPLTEAMALNGLGTVANQTGQSRQALEYFRQALVPMQKSGSRDNTRSEEHTSELQSQSNLVCRLLLEKKKPKK